MWGLSLESESTSSEASPLLEVRTVSDSSTGLRESSSGSEELELPESGPMVVIRRAVVKRNRDVVRPRGQLRGWML
jgi:hypothetical protein